MTTDLMEVYSLEEGDTIMHHGAYYKILEFLTPDHGGIDIVCADEEGYRRVIYAASPFDKIRLVCDADHYENA
jgi:hypothetical protein